MSISISQVETKSWWYNRRMHFAVGLGVASATAVMVGALLIGDSVRGSLRELTLDRLGKIDEVLVGERFFSTAVVKKLQESPGLRNDYSLAVGAIIFPHITLEARHEGRVARSSRVLVVGSDPDFWSLTADGPQPKVLPGDNEIILNEPLAAELQVTVGDEVTLRIPKATEIPADSPLADKTDLINSLAGLKVVGILPAKGLGRFSLQPSQSVPRNAFVSTTTLAQSLGVTGKCNAILVAGKNSINPAGPGASQRLAAAMQFELADFSVQMKTIVGAVRNDGSPRNTAFEYVSITTDRMLFSPATENVIRSVVGAHGGIALTTYLANSIERTSGLTSPSDGVAEGRNSVPYSMVTAIDFGPQFPLTDTEGREIDPLSEDEIVINKWTAQQIGAKPGDKIDLKYFAPETTHGQAIEKVASFRLKSIAPLAEPAEPFIRSKEAVYIGRRELGNDPDLTPTVAGITDQESMENWDAPFPFEYSRIKPQDDEYWKQYRTTPKAYISSAAGRKLWGSRFGDVTAFRVDVGNQTQRETELARRILAELSKSASTLGLGFIPIKRSQLEAARGATPFDILFLSLSFFVIAAALLLVAMLFRLGIEQRSGELGVMAAIGIRPRTLTTMVVADGILITSCGASLGVVLGIGYAWLMLAGLRTWWIGAITTPFLQFHWTSQSLVLGWLVGVFMALATIAWTMRQLNQVSVWSLLSGRFDGQNVELKQRIESRRPIVALGLCAMVLALAATRLGGMAQAGAFVGSGAMLLAALLIVVWNWLRSPASRSTAESLEKLNIENLAMRNARRHPGRSTVTIALVAAASFLIVALSSFRLAPTDVGTGGFNLMAESSEPIFVNLNDVKARKELFASNASELTGSQVFSFRLRSGDDASCNNLYQAKQPRVLGVTDEFINYFDWAPLSFGWAASAAETRPQASNPWLLLKTDDSLPVPVVVDKNTAMYSLHLYRGIGEEFEIPFDGGPTVRFRVAGLLENSILQGSLIISEQHFAKLFSDIQGYRFFLARTGPQMESQVASLLEERLSDEGFDSTPSVAVLEQLLAVQNTYLSTFQSLGALGLFLGTFGLAAVQLRNVLERRRELAVLRATGFTASNVARLVVGENLLLLTSGLACGILAALFAVIPHKILGSASIPISLLRDLIVMLTLVVGVGALTSWLASRNVFKLPLLKALRSE